MNDAAAAAQPISDEQRAILDDKRRRALELRQRKLQEKRQQSELQQAEGVDESKFINLNTKHEK